MVHQVGRACTAEAEVLAPFLKLNREVVFAMLRDLVIEESECSPFGLVAREPEGESVREPARFSEMSFAELLAEANRLADARHGQPRAPEWAVALDGEKVR